MNKQTINLTLFNNPTDYKCKETELKIEATLQTGFGEKNISEQLKGMTAECLFSLIKDFVNNTIEEEAKKMEITMQQFEAYLKVQREGKWNMLEPTARYAAGLSAEVYNYIIKHYDELVGKYEDLYNHYMGGK